MKSLNLSGKELLLLTNIFTQSFDGNLLDLLHEVKYNKDKETYFIPFEDLRYTDFIKYYEDGIRHLEWYKVENDNIDDNINIVETLYFLNYKIYNLQK